MASSGLPEVSVVVPTRGRWPLLSEALSSAFGQEDVNLEVIVVDDASTDETAARLREVRDPRLVVLRQDRSSGLAAARNAAVAAARGEWLAFLDDDDLWAPTNLRRKLDALQQAGADFAYGRVVMIDESNTPLYLFDLPDPSSILPRLLEANVIPGGPSNVVARTELVRHVGLFDERLPVMEDWDLFIRLANAGRCVACDDVLVALRKHSSNMSGDAGVDLTGTLQVLTTSHEALYRRLAVVPDRERIARWRAVERRWQLVAQAEQASRGGRRNEAVWLYLRAARECRRAADVRRAFAEFLPHAVRHRLAAGRPAPPTLAAPTWLPPRSSG